MRLLGERKDPIDLADPQSGTITTGWNEVPSLIYGRKRLGAPEDEGALPLPARYRFVVRIRNTEGGAKVTVKADEETNFQILTGTDKESGREYYKDRWRSTPTHTMREHEFLTALGKRLGEATKH
ncbi:MAG: hypothetical protein ACE5HV_02035 [Acidobacteriota bacterium]